LNLRKDQQSNNIVASSAPLTLEASSPKLELEKDSQSKKSLMANIKEFLAIFVHGNNLLGNQVITSH